MEAGAFLRRDYPTGEHRAGLWPGLRVQPLREEEGDVCFGYGFSHTLPNRRQLPDG